MTLSEELTWRGFVNQTTYPKLEDINVDNSKFYHGYDASADSLTIGNLAAVMMDKCFIRHGRNGVILAGGATSLIGDPGGKDSERPLQSEETIRKNVASVNSQLKSLLGEQLEFVNNLDWFSEMNVLTFLREVGKYFSVTPLIQRDYISKRIGEGGSGISFTELGYTLLQGYDYLELFEKYNVRLQLSGSDQWGNSLSGVELVKKAKNQTVNVFTCPLIVNKSTGKKFGKSESGAVWLDVNKTPVLDFYQFWIKLDDAGVEGYLKVFTELDKDSIDEVIVKHKSNPSGRHAQTVLADEVTKLVHGEVEVEKARQATKALVTGGMDHDGLSRITTKLPITIIELLVNSELVSSKSEARRLIESGGIYVNGTAYSKDEIEVEDFKDSKLILRRGKAINNSVVIELEA